METLKCATCHSIYDNLDKIIDGYFPKTAEHKIIDGKITKGALHMFCVFFYDGETCMRYIQTYLDLTMQHVWNGALAKDFFCGPILHICEDTKNYARSTLQFYQERVESTLKSTALKDNNFADSYYAENIRGKETTLQTYKVLHLNDLSIDLKYVAGASTDCSQFRCCHADENGEISVEDLNLAAGAFGSRNCDMPLYGA